MPREISNRDITGLRDDRISNLRQIAKRKDLYVGRTKTNALLGHGVCFTDAPRAGAPLFLLKGQQTMKLSAFAFAAVAVLAFATPAFAEDLEITVKNATSTALTELYVSHVGTNSWEENILEGTVDAGEDLAVTIADGRSSCEYDIKAVFSDGGHAEFRNQNLCKITTFTVHD